MKRKLICMMLALCLTFSCTVLTAASDAEDVNAASITISFGSGSPITYHYQPINGITVGWPSTFTTN